MTNKFKDFLLFFRKIEKFQFQLNVLNQSPHTVHSTKTGVEETTYA